MPSSQSGPPANKRNSTQSAVENAIKVAKPAWHWIQTQLSPPQVLQWPIRLYGVSALLLIMHGLWAGFSSLHLLLILSCVAMALCLNTQQRWAHFASILLAGVSVVAVPLGNAALRVYGATTPQGQWLYTTAVFSLALAALCSIACLWHQRD